MKYSGFLRSFFSLAAKLFVIAVLFFAGTYAFEVLNALHVSKVVPVTAQADGSLNIWWPTDGSHISDTQAFKAVIQDQDVNSYDMYWSVDGGQPNQMYTSQTDYPHKEAMVDLKNWNWHGSGPYNVTFRAVDHSGNTLAQASVNIFTPDQSGNTANNNQTTVQSGSVVQALTGITVASAATAGTPGASSSPSPSPTISVSPSSSPTPVDTSTFVNPSPAPQTQAVTVSPSINAWWPTPGGTVTGTTPFKAVLLNQPLSSYVMYWQVDGGQLNGMVDSQTDSPHKEASVDVSNWHWQSSGNYTITFIAKSLGNNEIARIDVPIHVGAGGSSPVSSPSPSLSPSPSASLSPSASPTPTPSPVLSSNSTSLALTPLVTTNQNNSGNSGNPFSGTSFYLDKNNDAENYANSIRSSDPTDAALIDKIGNTPTAVWLGNWNSDVGGYVKQVLSAAQSQNAMATFVIYNIPLRDCGQYSAGGANNPDGYKSWIQSIADATGNSKAAFILEPDATALTTCLSGSQLSDRYSMLQNAVSTLKSKPNAHVYIDAGHPNWISADDMASRLQQSGIQQADGFALNTSNFYTTSDNISYGTDLSNKVGGKHFVIDTGRNGSGPTPDQQWCNPPGMTLGSKPTANTGNSVVDAFLWLKGPGGSDGNCNGGPNAGVFWPQYALDMAKRSN